jgi:hypothetical protein
MRLSFLGVATAMLIVVSSLLPGVAVAASSTGSNLTTSPVSTAVSGKPGSTVTTTLQVQNNSSSAVIINVQLETFRAYGTNGAAQMVPFPIGDQSAKWVHFSEASFTAQPGVWVPIKMSISLPSDAGLGYYYAVVFKPQINVSSITKGNIIKGGNAVLVLVNAVSANEHQQIQVTHFAADKKLYQYLPANFSVAVKNTGNIFLPPTGDIYISRSSNFTGSIDTIPVNNYRGNVLPGTSRVFAQSWSDGFPVYTAKTVDGQKITNKKGQVEQYLKWNFSNANKFRFGKYYAKLVLVYQDNGRDIPIQAVVSFWIIPWKIISIIILVVALSMIGLYVSGHKLANRTFSLSKKVRKR